MTKLVVNVPDTAEGAPVEVVGFGLYKNGDEVDLGYDLTDEDGRMIEVYYAGPPPVKEGNTDGDSNFIDFPEDGGV